MSTISNTRQDHEVAVMTEPELKKPDSVDNKELMGRLDSQRVDFLVFDQKGDHALIDLFRSQPKWKLDFEGDGAAIFSRSSSGDSA